MPVAPGNTSRLRSLARFSLRALLVLVGASAIAGLAVIIPLGPKHELFAPKDLIVEPLVTLLPLVLGWLIHRKYPGHTIAFLFYVVAFFSIVTYPVAGLYLMHLEGLWPLPAGVTSALMTIGETTWQPNVAIPIFLIPLFFPTGRLLSPRWRWVVALFVLSLTFNLVAIALVPWPSLFVGPSPFVRPVNGSPALAPLFERAVGLFTVLFVLLFVLVTLAVLLRYRRSDGVVREQLKWPVWAVLCIVVVALMRVIFPAFDRLDELSGFVLTRAMGVLFPLSLGIAIWRQRLWDIDLVISRTVVYGLLSLFILSTYVGMVSGLGALFHTEMDTEGGLLATVIVAVLFQPLRGRLQRGVNRLLYGARDDPAAVLGELTRQIESVGAPDDILPNLVQTIARSLKLPFVAIELPDEENGSQSIVAWGDASARAITMPLRYHGATIGQLLIAPRDANGSFGQRDRALLQSIATLTANTVRAVQLSDALRRSRQRIVSAREEERRRLRRDLHDGLGPQLASQTLGLEAVSQLLERDPAAARRLLDSLKQQSHEATENVRRIVYDLRPPTLDELGLVAALRQSAARLGSNGLRFAFEPAEPLPELPAAVETAAYRIVQEAMTNVVRHADATRATVRIQYDGDQLLVAVIDDGVGLADEHASGVGLQSIRERAAELNGQIRVASRQGAGTTLEVWLPLAGE